MESLKLDDRLQRREDRELPRHDRVQWPNERVSINLIVYMTIDR